MSTGVRGVPTVDRGAGAWVRWRDDRRAGTRAIVRRVRGGRPSRRRVVVCVCGLIRRLDRRILVGASCALRRVALHAQHRVHDVDVRCVVVRVGSIAASWGRMKGRRASGVWDGDGGENGFVRGALVLKWGDRGAWEARCGRSGVRDRPRARVRPPSARVNETDETKGRGRPRARAPRGATEPVGSAIRVVVFPTAVRRVVRRAHLGTTARLGYLQRTRSSSLRRINHRR